MKEQISFLILMLFLAIHHNFSQESLPYQNLEIGQTDRLDRSALIMIDLDLPVKGKTPEEKAKNFIKNNWKRWGFTNTFEKTFNYIKTQETQSGTIVRHRQKYKGLKVDKNEIAVKLDTRGKVTTLVKTAIPIEQDLDIIPSITKTQALGHIKSYLHITGKPEYLSNELVIHLVKSKPFLCFEINITAPPYMFGWQGFVDANTGEILELKIAADMCFHETAESSQSVPDFALGSSFEEGKVGAADKTHGVNMSKGATTEALPITALAEGTGNVFSPNPTSSAKTPYGVDGFVDGDDSNNPDLEGELMTVTLQALSIGNNGTGPYQLQGSYAWCIDHVAPFDGNFSQNSPDFLFNRSDRAFEAVNCYYHIDKNVRYIVNELNVPNPASGSYAYDPHGGNFNISVWNYLPPRMHFGEGGTGNVDHAEDANIILHELGHAYHMYLTNYNNNNSKEGLNEGLVMYWAQSNIRDCELAGVWDEWDPEFHENPEWGGRPGFNPYTTNYTVPYQPPLSDTHTNGQHIATALMRIRTVLGQFKTDKLLLEAMPLLIEFTTLRQAGAIIYNTAINLNYSENDRCIIYKHMEDKFEISGDPTNVSAPSGGDGDIYMKDTPCDNGEEINPTTEFMFHSRDIWVRHIDDGELEHLDPEYKTSGYNYVYVRVRGLGCNDLTDATLRVYFSKASTLLYWPTRWNDYYTTGSNGQQVLTGDEITTSPIPIPAIEAGDEWIVSIPWTVPNPDDFTTDVHHFCLLARIESATDEMTFTEGIFVGDNSRNNNNIVTKNVSVFDEDPNNAIHGPISVFVGCDDATTNGTISVKSANMPLNKTIHDYGNVYLELMEPLNSNWINNGMLGDEYQIQSDGKIWAKNENFHLEGLPFIGCENQVIDVYFEPFVGARECAFDVVHFDNSGQLFGGERFEYRIGEEIGARSEAENITFVNSSRGSKLFPNPNGDDAIWLQLSSEIDKDIFLNIYNSQGLVVSKLKTDGQKDQKNIKIDIAGLSSGTYFLVLSNLNGKTIETLKFVKQ